MKAIRLKDVINTLQANGVVFVREGKGSHSIYKLGNKTTSIPNHKEVSPGVLRNIIRDLELNKQLFNH